MITRRNYITIGLVLLFFTLAYGLKWYYSKERNLAKYQQQIEHYLHSKESEVDLLFEDTNWLYRQAGIDEERKKDKPKEINKDLNKDIKNDMEKLEKLTNRPYNLLLFKKDTLLFWTNNRVLLKPEKVQQYLNNSEKTQLVFLENGYYELRKITIRPGKYFDYTAVALIPIYNRYALESDYLINQFVENYNIPQAVSLTTTANDFVVKTKSEKALFYLAAKDNFKDTSQQRILLFLYLMAFICLAVLVNDVAVTFVQKYKPWIGAMFLVSTVFLLRYLSIVFNFDEGFEDLHIFTRFFQTEVLQSSLGDMLINIVILLWLMVFFHREFKVRTFVNIPTPMRYFITALNYFSIILGMLMVISVFKSLVSDSGIKFDFDNVFNLNIYSLLAILGIILLIFALFLFSHRMVLTIMKIGLSRHKRMLCLAGALLISFPLVGLNELNISPPAFIFGALLYIGLFDWFIDSRVPNLTWLIIWLVVMAGFSSLLLFKYNNDEDLGKRMEYAEKLATWKDGIAEDRLKVLSQALQDNKRLEKIGNEPLIADNLEKIEQIVLRNFTSVEYLFNNYEAKVHIKSEQTAEYSAERQTEVDSIHQLWQVAMPTKYEPIRLWTSPAGDAFSYLCTRQFPGNDTADMRLILVEVTRNKKNPSKVYSELLLNEQYKHLEDLDKYDYAIYKNGLLIEDNGKTYNEVLHLKLPEKGIAKEMVATSDRSEVMFRAADETVVIMGKDMGGYLKPISLFSYLFGLLVVVVLLLAIVNSWTKALPEALAFSLTEQPSLGNRIQMSVISLILTSFVFIGSVTVWFFRTSSDQYHEDRLTRKVDSALKSAEHEIALLAKFDTIDMGLSQLVEPISEIHRMDINLYDVRGNLLASSEEGIFNKGIVAPKMGAYAYQQLSKMEASRGVQNEQVGDLPYKAAYVPLRNGNELVAYMGLPYYSKQRKLRSDVSDFMGTLINVYVFLLLLAGVFAIAVAKSISKPISDLGAHIRNVQLGRNKNQRIGYKRNDEVGQLIAEYNNMITKLEESTEQLKAAEREGAWREMAQQVAHEIKNPLTPMKLSIQHMLYVYKANPDNFDERMLKRVSGTLIEQIEGLTHIATEFSNFAKMPTAENTKFVINDLVSNVHMLFKNDRDDMDITLQLPSKEFIVFADKGQFLRVLNNLHKNAFEAIPDDRRGNIHTTLFKKDEKVVIKVSDNGTGILQEKQGQVFKPHFTTKNSGTGLGLAICRQIVESCGGHIYFDTVIGSGTDFYVEMPMIEERIAADEEGVG